MSDWTPPGYINVTELVRQHGVDKVRNDLFSGRLQAYKFDGTAGELYEIESKHWCMDGAERWLENGLPPDYPGHPFTVIVRVEEEPKPPPTTDGVYLPPFMAMMLGAVQHFKISAQNYPKKPELEEYFCDQKLPDGKPVSKHLAKQLATFCRPPAAMSGGNKKKG